MTKTFNLCGYQVSFKSPAQSSHQQHSNDAPPHSRTNPLVGDQPGLWPPWQGPSPQAPCLQVRYHLHLIITIGTSLAGVILPVLLSAHSLPNPTNCTQFSVSGIKGRDNTKSKHPYPALFGRIFSTGASSLGSDYISAAVFLSFILTS